ncbi:hypothetical protein BIFANG_03481 [Bifidobacterium angulatum DSM 20098 = JCM 7096]|uniref:Uncharacterized protein n=1 Tax=Bifidobacterium angulatum DSM 20098 = JCM 7096 TaxID=518635 RepID=C4FGK7_9BIFI|nr:hypothetical protein BIFANG_03481 [Bifidobacterium angulatum DSM 20098 = JCM 7096]
MVLMLVECGMGRWGDAAYSLVVRFVLLTCCVALLSLLSQCADAETLVIIGGLGVSQSIDAKKCLSVGGLGWFGQRKRRNISVPP